MWVRVPPSAYLIISAFALQCHSSDVGLAQQLGASPNIQGYETYEGTPFGTLRADPLCCPGFCCATPVDFTCSDVDGPNRRVDGLPKG